MHNFQLKLLDERGKPVRATPMSAGYDVTACINEPLVLERGAAPVLVPLGFACYMANGYVAGVLLPRSSMGHKRGMVLGNTVGVVDGDYQNQWFASVAYRGPHAVMKIEPGERLAQILFVPVIHPNFDLVEEFKEFTVRGLGGFGSTGRESILRDSKAGEISHPLKQSGVICGGIQPAVARPKTFETAAHDTVLPGGGLLYPMGSLGEAVDPTPSRPSYEPYSSSDCGSSYSSFDSGGSCGGSD